MPKKKSLEEIKDLSSNAKSAQQNVKDLTKQISHLYLITQAMWELIQTKTDLKETDLHEMINEIDKRDGVVNGRYTKSTDNCPDCERVVSPKTNTCIYCDIRVPRTKVF